jgi:hypothetical protein
MKKQSLLLIGILLLAAAPVKAGTTFDSAVQDYNSRNYAAALDKLGKLERSNPNNEKIHYYMALSFQGAAQIASAKEEYEWVADNAKSEQLKQNALTALGSIDKWSRTRRYSGNGNFFAHQRASVYRPRSQPVDSASSGST